MTNKQKRDLIVKTLDRYSTLPENVRSIYGKAGRAGNYDAIDWILKEESLPTYFNADDHAHACNETCGDYYQAYTNTLKCYFIYKKNGVL